MEQQREKLRKVRRELKQKSEKLDQLNSYTIQKRLVSKKNKK